MADWSVPDAIQELDRLADQTTTLATQRAGSAEHMRWQANVRRVLAEIFGDDSIYLNSFVALSWRRDGSVVVGGPMDPEGSMDPATALQREHDKAFREQLDSARGFILAARDELEANPSVLESPNTTGAAHSTVEPPQPPGTTAIPESQSTLDVVEIRAWALYAWIGVGLASLVLGIALVILCNSDARRLFSVNPWVVTIGGGVLVAGLVWGVKELVTKGRPRKRRPVSPGD